jgi:hypothetical protein
LVSLPLSNVRPLSAAALTVTRNAARPMSLTLPIWIVPVVRNGLPSTQLGLVFRNECQQWTYTLTHINSSVHSHKRWRFYHHMRWHWPASAMLRPSCSRPSTSLPVSCRCCLDEG